MKGRLACRGIILLALFSGPGSALVAQEEQAAADPPQQPVADAPAQRQDEESAAQVPVQIPVYVPPLRGAPVARVGGGTRGLGDGLPYVSVVTPEETGYTSSPQPVLYWYLSEPVDTRFEFALINDDEIEPIMELTSEKAMQKGLNFLDLSEHGVSLKPGVIYQWSVALVGEPEKRSADIVSSGTIELVELSDTQQAALQGREGLRAVAIYAREGYWYDAFAGLSRLIDAAPDDAALQLIRNSLLRQVGLDAIADSDG